MPPMRLAVFENLANSAYVLTKVLRRHGQDADLVLDPFDRYAMSDPRWEDLDTELATDQLEAPSLPAYDLPDWVHDQPAASTSRLARLARAAARMPAMRREVRLAARVAGPQGALLALERGWVVRTLADYDCVIAFGMGPAWAAIAGVPCVAVTWGGDITMVPFYDTGDWEGHESLPLPEPHRERFAEAKLQRLGYEHAARIVLPDPRFVPFAERLGHAEKIVRLGLFVDTERYAPGPEVELRRSLLGADDGLIVFMPSRHDWFWKGTDRLLRAFARATEGRADVVLVCAGWGADLERSKRLIAELGIGDRVLMLPYVMSKGRLRRYYRASDVVADQFTIGSYGVSALEAMSCARPLLIALEEGRFDPFPPVVNVSEPDAIARALGELLADHGARSRVGERAREWVIANHGPSLVRRVIDVCETVAR
jgi:glycosyltransferase involved in cell wall biosynthesis